MGRTVVVAEKPSVGRDIARVLGCKQSGKGCLSNDRWIVTWAVGHLVTLVEPDELDEKYKRWTFDTLPILPDDIPLKVIASSLQSSNPSSIAPIRTKSSAQQMPDARAS